jgi:hypothetical protein
MSAVLVLTACAAPSATPSTSPAPTPGTSGSITPPSSTGGASSPAPQIEADSVTKIAAAEAAGTIDHDTALVYELYAALDYGRLPVEYQSSNPAAPEATTILAELSLRGAQLSPDLQAKVAPFLLRPDDPASSWATRSAARGPVAEPIVAAAYVAEVDCTVGPYFACVDAGNTPVRVWYDISQGGAKEQAVALAAEIDRVHMWTTEQIAMLGHTPCSDGNLLHNGGNNLLDIYVVSKPDFAFDGRKATLNLEEDPKKPPRFADGLTVPEAPDSACGEISFIVLNGHNSADKLKIAAAHELFHAFQYSFKNALQSDHYWWLEATATWAEDLVYAADPPGYEQAYLNGYWAGVSGPEGPLDTFKKNATPQYAAYLWPFYLRQKLGSTNGSVIGQLWQASESDDPLDAIAKLAGWPDKWKEFALWNWNRDDPQMIKYRDPTTDTAAVIPPAALWQLTACMSEADGCENSNPDGSKWSLLTNGKHTVPIGLQFASVEYLAARPDKDVQKLTFDLSDVRGKTGIGLQALVWIGDPDNPSEIKVEDWSDLAKREFCLNDDDVRKVVLVVSDSNTSGLFGASIKVEGLPSGCVGWRGTMTATQTWGPGAQSGSATSSFEGLWTVDPTAHKTCSVGPQELQVDCVTYRPTGAVTWTWDAHIVDGPRTCNSTTAGSADPAAVTEPDARELNFAAVDKDHLQVSGFGGFDVPQLKCGFFEISANRPPQYFQLAEAASSLNEPDQSGGTCYFTTWQIEVKATTFKGSCVDFDYSAPTFFPHSRVYTWDLTRTGATPGG